MAQAERAPETRLYQQQNTLNQQNNAFGSIKTQLGILQTRVDALKDATLYDSRIPQVSDSTLGSATVTDGAALGTFTFNVSQLATAARLNGQSDAGSVLSADGDLSAFTLADAGFATGVSAGTFTVNGKQISIDTTDTLQQVFDKIATATNNEVTASYDTGTDKITLSSSSEIILGSATDTSNFLQVARLNNNGTGAITSSVALGGVRLSATLSSANLATAVTDGGSGAGEFKINGVSISFDASTDSVSDVLSRINNSGAGVTATYDSLNDRFVLTNKTTGDLGVALEDVTGNFLAATGLSSGSVQRGQNLIYTVNNSDPLISQSNTITEASSGVAGLSFTALKAGESSVTVSSDTGKIKTAITDFIDAYNKAQSLIETQTASSTDAQGKVTAGVLAGDGDANDIASSLRKAVFSVVNGLSGTISHLADLGIQTNGNDNNLSLDDSTKLDSALSNNLTSVKELFSDSTNGIAVTLSSYLDHTIGDSGTLIAHQDSLTKQSADIDTQVAAIEKQISADSDRLTNEFIAMETAQANINQQLAYLTKQFGG